MLKVSKRNKELLRLEEDFSLSIVKTEMDDGHVYAVYLSILDENLVFEKPFDTELEADDFAKEFLQKLTTLIEDGGEVITNDGRTIN